MPQVLKTGYLREILKSSLKRVIKIRRKTYPQNKSTILRQNIQRKWNQGRHYQLLELSLCSWWQNLLKPSRRTNRTFWKKSSNSLIRDLKGKIKKETEAARKCSPSALSILRLGRLQIVDLSTSTFVFQKCQPLCRRKKGKRNLKEMRDKLKLMQNKLWTFVNKSCQIGWDSLSKKCSVLVSISTRRRQWPNSKLNFFVARRSC